MESIAIRHHVSAFAGGKRVAVDAIVVMLWLFVEGVLVSPSACPCTGTGACPTIVPHDCLGLWQLLQTDPVDTVPDTATTDFIVGRPTRFIIRDDPSEPDNLFCALPHRHTLLGVPVTTQKGHRPGAQSHMSILTIPFAIHMCMCPTLPPALC